MKSLPVRIADAIHMLINHRSIIAYQKKRMELNDEHIAILMQTIDTLRQARDARFAEDEKKMAELEL